MVWIIGFLNYAQLNNTGLQFQFIPGIAANYPIKVRTIEQILLKYVIKIFSKFFDWCFNLFLFSEIFQIYFNKKRAEIQWTLCIFSRISNFEFQIKKRLKSSLVSASILFFNFFVIRINDLPFYTTHNFCVFLKNEVWVNF